MTPAQLEALEPLAETDRERIAQAREDLGRQWLGESAIARACNADWRRRSALHALAENLLVSPCRAGGPPSIAWGTP